MIHNAQLNRFGYDYRLIETGEFTTLKNDSLVVEITYNGCAPGHDYSLEFERKGTSIFDLWLFKKTPDEECLAIIRDIRSFKIPQELIHAQRIVLFNPVNDKLILKN